VFEILICCVTLCDLFGGIKVAEAGLNINFKYLGTAAFISNSVKEVALLFENVAVIKVFCGFVGCGFEISNVTSNPSSVSATDIVGNCPTAPPPRREPNKSPPPPVGVSGVSVLGVSDAATAGAGVAVGAGPLPRSSIRSKSPPPVGATGVGAGVGRATPMAAAPPPRISSSNRDPELATVVVEAAVLPPFNTSGECCGDGSAGASTLRSGTGMRASKWERY